ncbi:MAG TPA: phosphodiester glycosidase family protein [Pyrinomonadaceae bacterium]|nr:phosphodiester glycosidase family protein [Pyrinomonadaceae bacterium]
MNAVQGIFFGLLIACTACGGCTSKSTAKPTPETVQPGLAKPVAASARFTTVRVDLRTERLELFLRDEKGHAFNRFDQLASWLAGRKQQLRFAMNAGMYQTDFSPVGLLVVDGREISPLNVAAGSGNFFMKPNGVFLVSNVGPRIVETSEYPTIVQDVRLATQSGPLLLRKGVINPAFDPASTSRLLRNGVGISGDTIVFVISDQPVNFYEFAVFFRDHLQCSDALYLDGVVSSLYSVDLKRNDNKTDLGPIVAVVQ